MIWPLLLAQMTAALPIDLTKWLTPEDTPMSIMRENYVYSVSARIDVQPNGKLQGCSVEASSGDIQVDRYACTLVLRKGSFQTAIDSSGRPIHGVYRMMVRWWYGEYVPRSLEGPADLTLRVSALPPPTKSPVRLGLMFEVDETGRTSSCDAQKAGVDRSLISVGCKEFLKNYTASPAKNAEGAFVRSVQTGTVEFRTN